MTVSYQYDVASSTSGGFTRLLFKWKGSLYKLVYRELFMFIVAYSAMSITYRYFFTEAQKRSFEQVALYCDTFMNYIPLSFILGFYVSFVASRWWQQYMAIPWPDKLLHSIAVHVSGYDDHGRMLRRTMVRYLNLSLVLVLRSISSAVKRRFPTFDHIVEAGFMTTTELQIYKTVPSTEFNTYWVPFTWFTALVREASLQKRIGDPFGAKLIMEEFNEFRQLCGMLWSYDWVAIPLVYTQAFLEFRSQCGLLWCYDWVSIPLVYTQVVTIATYCFFIACIVGRQYVEKSPIPYKVKPDLYIPYFTLLQFFFYMGLLKVAEQLINPFGDDDEDFELNWIIDRHMKVSYLIVDTLILKTPPLTKDIYYDQAAPVLPYTEAAVHFKKKVHRGSVAHMMIPEDKQTFILPDIEEESDEERSEFDDQTKKGKVASGLFTSTGAMLRDTSFASGDSASSMTPYASEHKHSGETPSPKSGLGSKFGSVMAGRRGSGSRSGSSPGTLGHVGSAVAAVGTNQILLATGPDSVSSIPEEILDYVILPIEDDRETTHHDHDGRYPQVANKPYFKLPASLKAKIAVRKKPVMKWKPYHRPPEVRRSLDEIIQESIPEGCYEEECAFMWRTIEEDTADASKSFIPTPPPSTMRHETEDNLHRDSFNRSPRTIQDHRVLSHYAKKAQLTERMKSTFPRSIPPSLMRPIKYRSSRKSRFRKSDIWKPDKIDEKIKPVHHRSLPQLANRGNTETSLSKSKVKSSSENSLASDDEREPSSFTRRMSNDIFEEGIPPPEQFRDVPSGEIFKSFPQHGNHSKFGHI